MSALTKVLTEWGTTIEAGSNNRIDLGSSQKVWLVNTGKFDVFYIKPDGRLNHLLRAEEGDLVFGINPISSDGALVLSGIGSVGTELTEFGFDRFTQALADPNYREEAIHALETWLIQLGTSFTKDLRTPKKFVKLVTGEDLEIKEQDALYCRKRVFWTQLIDTDADYLGLDGATIGSVAGNFPMAEGMWAIVQKEGKVRAVDTETYLQNDPKLRDLEVFHQFILGFVLRISQDNEDAERRRIEGKLETDRKVTTKALLTLSSVLNPGQDQLYEMLDTDAPLLAVFRLVAKASGIESKVKVRDNLKEVKDPVGVVTRAAKVRSREVILAEDWYRSECGPLIGFSKNGRRPIALLPAPKRRYEMIDPEKQIRKIVEESDLDEIEAKAYMIYRPLPEKPLKFMDLVRYSKFNVGKELWIIILTGLAGGLLGMVTPHATGIIFDSAIPKADRTELTYISMGLLICAISAGIFTLTGGMAMLRFEGKTDRNLQAAIWDRLLNLPVPFFRQFTSGDLAERAMAIDGIRQQLSGSVAKSIISSIFTVFNLFQLFYYSWKLALLGMGLTFIALVPLLLGIIKVRYERVLSDLEGQLSGIMFQFISGISKLRAAGAEARAFSAWAKVFSKEKTAKKKAGYVQNVVEVWNSIFSIIASMAIFTFMVFVILDSDTSSITTGTFLAFNAAFTQFLAAILGLSDTLVSVLVIFPLFERVKPILEAKPEVDSSSPEADDLTGHIEISRACFRYDKDGPLIIDDVSFKVEPGEFVALVGPSGSGKSTLFRMLLGFETPESGAIYYDGQELSSVDVRSIRRQLGVVLQNGKLMSGDIFKNIVGALPLTINEAWDAARMAGLEEDIRKMPMGMHTIISDGSGNLSGGQTQRVLIARALVGKPRILYFDEATSALDNQTQAAVSKSLEELKTTRIVIAHRLSTIINADRILVLENGVLVEQGTYEELVNQDGLFAELAKRQIA